MRAVLGLAVLLFVGGCQPAAIAGDGTLVVFTIDPTFSGRTMVDGHGVTRDEMAAIRLGIHEWSAAGANFAIEGELAKDADVSRAMIYSIHRNNSLNADGEEWPGLTYSSINDDRIAWQRWPNFEGLQSTVAHEIGHALGLGHTTGNGVMNPDESLTELGPDDRQMFADRWPR